MGKKAFSGKQKKEQLQKKRDNDAKRKGPKYDEAAFDRAMEHEGADGRQAPDATLGADKGGVRSAFKQESDTDVRARKRLSYLPIGERRNNPAVPYGDWFTMPFAGDLDDPLNDIVDPFERNAARATGYAPLQSPTSPKASSAGPGSPSRTVYTWKQTPRFLPLPYPSEHFADIGHHHAKRSEIEAMKADEAARFEQWTAAMEAADAADDSGGINQYERNLDVWKQLWFTVDHSDVVMIIADARYAVVHAPLSLLRFIVVDQKRKAVVVINKSDLLPPKVMDEWIRFLSQWYTAYLVKLGVKDPSAEFKIVQMCCTPDRFLNDIAEEAKFGQKRRKISNTQRKQQDLRKLAHELEDMGLSSTDVSDSDEQEMQEELSRLNNFKGQTKAAKDDMATARAAQERAEKMVRIGHAIDELLDACHELGGKGTRPRPRSRSPSPQCSPAAGPAQPPSSAMSAMLGDELELPANNVHGPTTMRTLCIGLVGNPNVGKSSLINVIRGMKTVSVSPTPGHTKHMQTVNLPRDNIVLYDCPGLCFPVLGIPRPLQTILGTHQIAQTRDPASGVAYLARHLNLERMYGLRKIYDEDAHWSAHELCEAFATKRGFLNRGKGGGSPDVHRAAIAILQEAYAGRLVLFFTPPAVEDLARLLESADATTPIATTAPPPPRGDDGEEDHDSDDGDDGDDGASGSVDDE